MQSSKEVIIRKDKLDILKQVKNYNSFAFTQLYGGATSLRKGTDYYINSKILIDMYKNDEVFRKKINSWKYEKTKITIGMHQHIATPVESLMIYLQKNLSQLEKKKLNFLVGDPSITMNYQKMEALQEIAALTKNKNESSISRNIKIG